MVAFVRGQQRALRVAAGPHANAASEALRAISHRARRAHPADPVRYPRAMCGAFDFWHLGQAAEAAFRAQGPEAERPLDVLREVLDTLAIGNDNGDACEVCGPEMQR